MALAIAVEALGGVSAVEALIYDAVAFAARYGHQQRSEILSMTSDDLQQFNRALGKLIAEENNAGRGPFEAGATGG